ncbi:MAG: hypothetical protein Kow0090_17390 [Myxococcota bacterium]
MMQTQYISESVPNLRELISPRELSSLLSAFTKFLSAPVWVVDIHGNPFASAEDAESQEFRKTLLFDPPEEITSGNERMKTITVGNEHIFLASLDVPEGTAGILASIPGLNFDAQKLETLKWLIESLLRAGWKNAMTNEMHTAAMNVSHRELEEQNRRLNEMLRRLRTLDEAKTTFMQTISHELKTPLTSIIGYAELLGEGIAGEVNAEQKEYINTILEKGQTLLDMITNVLDITRLGTGKEDLELNFHTVEEIVTQAIEATAAQAMGKNIEVFYQPSDNLKPVLMDSVRISRALAALLSNAVKFSPENSKVAVKASIQNHERLSELKTPFDLPEEEVLAISVEDQGIGIPTDELDKIFESFYQVDNSSTREFGGTGLGLTLAKNFVEAHGGKIEVISAPGRGSRFTILLPIEIRD